LETPAGKGAQIDPRGAKKVPKMPKLAEPKAPTVYSNAKPKAKEYAIADGNGLYLVVNVDGTKLWDFRYRFAGRRRKLAIKGGFPTVGVKAAREEATRYRAMISEGLDPSEVRKSGKLESRQLEEAQRVVETKSSTTFEKVTRDWFKMASEHLAHKNGIETMRRMEKNVFPWIGAKPISDIRPPDILAPLRLVEERGARESAHRILGVCGQIFRFAVASGFVESDPSRDLRGALAKPNLKHFASITNPEEVGALLRSVTGYQGNLETRVALKLGIQTFVRPGNLRMAEWEEFHNLDEPDRAEWRIPGSKMKVKTTRPFIVPLAPQSVTLVESLRPLAGKSKFLFPSIRTPLEPMSNNSVNAALRRMGYTTEEFTGHGVRAMARTLCHEVLGFAPEVIEEQLAHAKSGPLGGAYDRTTHLPDRRRLMREWAAYLERLEAGETSSCPE
jgi:integrase